MLDSILFKQVDMVFPEGIRRGDLWVKAGKIIAIGPSLPEYAEFILHEEGLLLMPGVIDPHVHFREPGADHKETIETGSMAAASGGVTSFFDMPNTNPSTTTVQALEYKKNRAAQTSLVNYNFFIGATPTNLDELILARNVPGIKLYIGSTTGNLLVDQSEHLEEIFKKSNKLIAVHAEDNGLIEAQKRRYKNSVNPADHANIRPPEAALKATQLAYELSKKYNRRLHICHMSTEEEVLFLTKMKPYAPVTCEVTPQHLLLIAPGCYDKLGTFAQMNPPLREVRHSEALFKALKSGLIDCVATDHAPHTIQEKQQPFWQAPSGIPGVETSLSLMLTLVNQGKLTLQQVLSKLCEGPTKVFGIAKKGKLAIGYDADFVLVDLKGKKTISAHAIHSKCGWSAFEDWEVQGVPIATFVRGQMVYREGQFFTAIKGKEIVLQTKPTPETPR